MTSLPTHALADILAQRTAIIGRYKKGIGWMVMNPPFGRGEFAEIHIYHLLDDLMALRSNKPPAQRNDHG